MASEAITRTDLTNILNEVLPPTPSEYRKLLWTNPSPTSGFAAQTISLDLSNYDDIEIFFVGAVTNSNYSGAEQKFPINSGQLLSMFAPQALGTPRPQRGLTISSTGIVFTAGGYTVGTTYTSNNDYCVPVKIYGIKYERVAPPQAEIADYIVEQGTSGIWTYRKWNSGEYEAIYTTGMALDAGTAWWTGGYYHKSTYGMALPSFALDWHLKSAQKSDGTLSFCVGAIEESDGLHFYWVNGSASAVSGTNFINTIVTICGRWK